MEPHEGPMKSRRETKPFPHKRFTTSLPRSERDAYTLWDELVNHLARTYLDPEEWDWAFRGISQHDHKLESKLERDINTRKSWRKDIKNDTTEDAQTTEDYLFSQFKKAAHHFAAPSMIPKKSERLEWLALMQHYSAPTRLLAACRGTA
jgi:FRG domain